MFLPILMDSTLVSPETSLNNSFLNSVGTSDKDTLTLGLTTLDINSAISLVMFLTPFSLSPLLSIALISGLLSFPVDLSMTCDGFLVATTPKKRCSPSLNTFSDSIAKPASFSIALHSFGGDRLFLKILYVAISASIICSISFRRCLDSSVISFKIVRRLYSLDLYGSPSISYALNSLNNSLNFLMLSSLGVSVTLNAALSNFRYDSNTLNCPSSSSILVGSG